MGTRIDMGESGKRMSEEGDQGGERGVSGMPTSSKEVQGTCV